MMQVPERGECEAGESPALSRNCDADEIVSKARSPACIDVFEGLRGKARIQAVHRPVLPSLNQ
jgi:hypothetical protein